MFVAWCVPFVFLFLALSRPEMPGGELVLPLSLCCALSSAIYLFSIRGRLWQTLWSRVIFVVLLLGYLFKSLLFLYWYHRPEQELWFELDWLTPQDVVAAYPVFAAAFSAFCLVAAILALVAPVGGEPASLPDAPRTFDRSRVRSLLFATVALSLLATILPLVLGFGVMGGEGNTLPYRLDAPITRFRINIGPALLLWVLWLSDSKETARLWILALIALLAVGLLDGFLRSSRGSLATLMLPAILLWLLTHRFTRSRIAFGVGLFCLFVVLYPIFSYQRTFRMLGIGAAEGVVLALRAAPQGELLTPIAFKIGTRVSGAEGLLYVSSRLGGAAPGNRRQQPTARIGELLSARAMARYTTEQMWGVHDIRESRPPGILGALAIVGGSIGAVVPLFIVFLLGVWFLWWICVSLRIAPVALSLFASMLLTYVSEGVLGLQDPIGFIISIAIVSAAHHWATMPHKERWLARDIATNQITTTAHLPGVST